MRLTIPQRLSVVFAVLLLVCSSTSAWLQLRANRMHEQEVVQSLSRGLAEHIATRSQLMDSNGPMPGAVSRLFTQLMMVNPSVEVYLLDMSGRIVEYAESGAPLRHTTINLVPVNRLMRGDALPILGDDPRSDNNTKKVFSAAPLLVNNVQTGYIYVVLLNQAHDILSGKGSTSAALNTALWSIALVALLCLIAGLTAFAFITRPLRQLTDTVRQFDMTAEPAKTALRPVPLQSSHKAPDNDDIAVLDTAFHQMATRINEQWRKLTQQDQERREFIANISHDLRTPLASLHGYLETLLLKDSTLNAADRKRYLGIALDQSSKVGNLSRSLFELVRLEQGYVQVIPETFQLTDLVQDVFQKFELPAETKHIALTASFHHPIPAVYADLGLIERALTNLIDNALRHTPDNGTIDIAIKPNGQTIDVVIKDTGPGIAAPLRDTLFQRSFNAQGARREGGLGLRIVYRIIQLHGHELALLASQEGQEGAAFGFSLNTAASQS